jgi:uridylate kinase
MFLSFLAKKIVTLVKEKWIEIAIVVGGGNIFRGIELEAGGLDRSAGDSMGMLGTIINGIALWEALEAMWVHTRVMSAVSTHKVAEDYIRRRAIRHMEKWRIVICVWGTGNPYFTTDSAAVLRALELSCDCVVKATKVDGIYDKDPKKHTDATRYDTVSFHQVMVQDIRVMDQASIALARDEEMPIWVCKIEDIDQIGTLDIQGTYVR